MYAADGSCAVDIEILPRNKADFSNRKDLWTAATRILNTCVKGPLSEGGIVEDLGMLSPHVPTFQSIRIVMECARPK